MLRFESIKTLQCKANTIKYNISCTYLVISEGAGMAVFALLYCRQNNEPYTKHYPELIMQYIYR